MTDEFGGIPVNKPDEFGGVPVERKASIGDLFKRQLGRTARIAAEAVGALPNIAMDPFIEARNALTGSNYPTASEMYGEALDSVGLPRAEGALEKGVDIAGQMLLTSKIPNPSIKAPAPDAFGSKVSQLSDEVIKNETIRQSQKAGYLIPPASARPTAKNTVLESVSGKAATQQTASAKNQKVTNRLVTGDLGLPNGTPLTEQVLSNLRLKAGSIYGKIKKTGEILADDQYIDDLTKLGKSVDDLKADFPDANLGANEQVTKLVDSLLKDKFSANGALEYIKQLRKDASGAFSGAYDPSKQALGIAQRQAAEILENLVQRHLEKSGKIGLAQKYRDARTLIAKTYIVSGALNEATGNVNAVKIAQQLAKGKPLSGGLETVAKFARAFPKAAEEIRHSPGVSAVDALVGMVGGSTIHPALYLEPIARYGTRQAIMSKPYQSGLVQSPEIQKQARNIGIPSAILIDAMMKALPEHQK